MQRAVILSALKIEYQAVRTYLIDLKEETHPKGTVYERGNFIAKNQSWDVGIVEIGKGNPIAAIEAERAISHFNPDVVFFVGIAGGLKDVNLGDVVAATKVYGYEFGKVEKTFQSRPEIWLSDFGLIHRAKAESKKDNWLRRIHSSMTKLPPNVFVGPIAAGEKVIASKKSDIIMFLKSHYNDVLAVEMEGLGFLQAMHANKQVSAMVIRGISDLIDKKSEIDRAGYQITASRHASAFAFELLSNFNIPKVSEVGDSSRNKAIDIWLDRRDFFEIELAKAADSARKYELRKLIDECNHEIIRLSEK